MTKFWRTLILLFAVTATISFSSCSDDDDLSNRDFDGTLYGEWVEDNNKYIHDYYCFYSDGTGIHGSWESDIDYVNEDDDIEWYTVDDKGGGTASGRGLWMPSFFRPG